MRSVIKTMASKEGNNAFSWAAGVGATGNSAPHTTSMKPMNAAADHFCRGVGASSDTQIWGSASCRLSPTTPTIFAIFGSGSDTVLQPAVKSKPAYALGERPLSNTGKLAQPRVHCTAKVRPWSAKAVALIESPAREPGPLDGEKGVTRPIAWADLYRCARRAFAEAHVGGRDAKKQDVSQPAR